MPSPFARTCYAFIAALALIAAALVTAVLAASRSAGAPVQTVAVAHLATAGGDASPLALPLLPPLTLNASSEAPPPVAGHGYEFFVGITNVVSVPAVALGLFIHLTPGLTLAGSPPGCFPVPGGLFCGYLILRGGQSIPITVNVIVASGLGAGASVGISAVLRYDLGLEAFASVSRQVVTPTPPPTHTPTPPPTRTPTPPPPRHSQPPSPPPPPHKPVPPATHPVVAPPPPHHQQQHQHRKPRPRPPHPTPAAFSAIARRPIAPEIATPHPVIPIGVLLAVILTPCVAAAATRFGKSIHHH